MRKSIFLTVILALFASVSAFAQDSHLTGTIGAASVTCIDATALSCTDDPLHPLAGKQYDYSVTVTPPEGNYTWFVTTSTDILGATGLTTERQTVGGDIIAAASANYNVATANTTTDANKVQITWKHTTTSPVLLVMYVEGTGTSCADNLKVYKIEPKNAFTLEIANLNPEDGTGTNADESCVDDVESATFNGTNMVYDYGENYLYFIVNAASFDTSWTPSFQIEGLDTVQTAEVAYSKSNDLNNWTTTTLNSGTYEGSAVTPQSGTFIGEDGECIVVRVKIDHSKYELTADQEITLKVDGVTKGGENDVDSSCVDEGEMADSSTQTIKARPAITNGTTGGDFIPVQP